MTDKTNYILANLIDENDPEWETPFLVLNDYSLTEEEISAIAFTIWRLFKPNKPNIESNWAYSSN
jgi:hypothetical protein